MTKLLNREESIENLKDNLSYFLCEYDKDVKKAIIKHIVKSVEEDLNSTVTKFNANDFSIEACEKSYWHDENNNGLYFNMKLSYKEHSNGKIDLILDGTYVGDYDTGYDFGIQLKNGKIQIPLNYKKEFNFFSYLLGWS